MKLHELWDLLPKPSLLLRHLVVVSYRRIMQLRHVVDHFRVLETWSQETLKTDPKTIPKMKKKTQADKSDPSGKLLSAKRARDTDLRIQASTRFGSQGFNARP